MLYVNYIQLKRSIIIQNDYENKKKMLPISMGARKDKNKDK